jgi:hypothetical protein
VVHEFCEGNIPEFGIWEDFPLGGNASSWHLNIPLWFQVTRDSLRLLPWARPYWFSSSHPERVARDQDFGFLAPYLERR